MAKLGGYEVKTVWIDEFSHETFRHGPPLEDLLQKKMTEALYQQKITREMKALSDKMPK